MKTPVVYNAEPFKTDVIPLIVRGPYDVYVGDLEGYKLPTYLIINRTTSVVEFTSEVLPIIENWLSQAVPLPGLLDNMASAQQLSLNLKNTN